MEASESICLDIKQAYKIIAQHEAENNVKFIVFTSPKNFGNIDPTGAKKLYWSDLPCVKHMRREFTGVPFVPLGIKMLDCEYGKDRKTKRKQKKMTELNTSEHDYAEMETTQPASKISKKRNCPAQCFIREIVEFPEFKSEKLPSPYDQQQLWMDIHDKLNAGYEIECLRRFVVRLPPISAHTGHPVIEAPLVNSQQDQLQDTQDTYSEEDDAEVVIENVAVDTHLLTLNVTPDQETAIVELFEDRGWDFIPLETHEIKLEHEVVPEPGLELEFATHSPKDNDGYVHTPSQIIHLPEFTAQSVSAPLQTTLEAVCRNKQPNHASTALAQPVSNPLQTTLNAICRNVQPSQASSATAMLLNTVWNDAVANQSGKQNARTEIIFTDSANQIISKESLTFGELNKLFEQSLEEMPSLADEPEQEDQNEGQHIELLQAAQQATGDTSTDKVKKKRKQGLKGKVSYSNRMLGSDAEDEEEEVDESGTKITRPKRKKQRKQNEVKQVVGNFKCTDCNDTYRFLNVFNRHKRDGRCRYECDQCDKVFTSRTYTSYLVHLKYHSKERAFKCRLCEVSYIQLAELKNHMRSKHSDGTNICELCGLCFESTQDLLAHKHVIHNAKQQVFQCDICGRKSASKHTLASHKELVHTDNKPVVCRICGKRFKTKKTLYQTHAKIHESEGVFKCQLPGCRNYFFTSEELTKHMKRHNNIPSRFCSICGQGFYNKKELALHARTHSGDKIHACQYCDFRCTHPGNLTKHVKTHLKIV